MHLAAVCSAERVDGRRLLPADRLGEGRVRDAVLTPAAAAAERGEGRHVLLKSIRWDFTLPPNGGVRRDTALLGAPEGKKA